MCLCVFGHISEYMSVIAHICLHVQILLSMGIAIYPCTYPWVCKYEYMCLDTSTACACIVCHYVCRCELEDIHIYATYIR